MPDKVYLVVTGEDGNDEYALFSDKNKAEIKFKNFVKKVIENINEFNIDRYLDDYGNDYKKIMETGDFFLRLFLRTYRSIGNYVKGEENII